MVMIAMSTRLGASPGSVLEAQRSSSRGEYHRSRRRRLAGLGRAFAIVVGGDAGEEDVVVGDGAVALARLGVLDAVAAVGADDDALGAEVLEVARHDGD